MPKLPKQPKDFKANQAAERQFARALRKVAVHASHVVETHVHGEKVENEAAMLRKLTEYAEALDPWARRQASKMIERVAKKNRTAWTKNSREMAKLLKVGVAQADVGRRAAQLMQEQVDLIKSLPLRAGLRAQGLAQKAVYEGTRASEIAEELAATQEVSEADAERIARTEVARANSVITQARAEAAGSKQYVWRNSGDASVRESHKKYHGKKLDGMVFSWDSPPTLDDGMTGHPGTFPNCRCYPEPFFPNT